MKTLGIVLLDGYRDLDRAMLAEAFRTANEHTGQELYQITYWQEKDVTFVPPADTRANSISDTVVAQQMFDTLFVVGVGSNVKSISDHGIGWIRRNARRSRNVAATGSGLFALAYAGLVKPGARVTLDWELSSAFQEEWLCVDVVNRSFVIDDGLFSSVGGIASVHLAIALIGQDFGFDLAAKVADRLGLERIHGAEEQHRPLQVFHQALPRTLSHAIQAMEGNIEEPLSIADLALAAGVSPRQLQRLFQRYLDVSPVQYYNEIRLARARCLVEATDLSVSEIACATGFQSHSQFSGSFKSKYGVPPRALRMNALRQRA